MKKMFDSWGSHVKKIPLQGLLCLFILCLSLPLHAQNEEGKININVKDASVKEVLEVLKKYNYRLVYWMKFLKKRIWFTKSREI